MKLLEKKKSNSFDNCQNSSKIERNEESEKMNKIDRNWKTVEKSQKKKIKKIGKSSKNWYDSDSVGECSSYSISR